MKILIIQLNNNWFFIDFYNLKNMIIYWFLWPVASYKSSNWPQGNITPEVGIRRDSVLVALLSLSCPFSFPTHFMQLCGRCSARSLSFCYVQAPCEMRWKIPLRNYRICGFPLFPFAALSVFSPIAPPWMMTSGSIVASCNSSFKLYVHGVYFFLDWF